MDTPFPLISDRVDLAYSGSFRDLDEPRVLVLYLKLQPYRYIYYDR